MEGSEQQEEVLCNTAAGGDSTTQVGLGTLLNWPQGHLDTTAVPQAVHICIFQADDVFWQVLPVRSSVYDKFFCSHS